MRTDSLRGFSHGPAFKPGLGESLGAQGQFSGGVVFGFAAGEAGEGLCGEVQGKSSPLLSGQRQSYPGLAGGLTADCVAVAVFK